MISTKNGTCKILNKPFHFPFKRTIVIHDRGSGPIYRFERLIQLQNKGNAYRSLILRLEVHKGTFITTTLENLGG